mgnify:CR=1 FL=1
MMHQNHNKTLFLFAVAVGNENQIQVKLSQIEPSYHSLCYNENWREHYGKSICKTLGQGSYVISRLLPANSSDTKWASLNSTGHLELSPRCDTDKLVSVECSAKHSKYDERKSPQWSSTQCETIPVVHIVCII